MTDRLDKDRIKPRLPPPTRPERTRLSLSAPANTALDGADTQCILGVIGGSVSAKGTKTVLTKGEKSLNPPLSRSAAQNQRL
ncbi:hypothetical protein CesoFtcFv8_005485 [Champsocephalus esox]|uniref:Uncharacterized protein n=1 Tax=Champsocephalus esox TaxID=159716 RepID=A0AAN8CPP9_9TELE|nr:hypothetical protein CesoFtcFv8_005485 [Champsocephalus esox]